MKKKKRKKINKIARIALSILLWLGGTVVVVLAGFFVLLYFIHLGPSPRFRDLFVASAKESSVGGVLVDLYLSEDQVKAIMASNSTQEFKEVTNTSLIQIAQHDDADANGGEEQAENPEDPDGDGITIYEVHGPTYRGKMMVVFDPSRVKVGTIDTYGIGAPGLTLPEIVKNTMPLAESTAVNMMTKPVSVPADNPRVWFSPKACSAWAIPEVYMISTVLQRMTYL